MKIIVLTIFLLLSKLFAFSQHRNTVSKDSIAIWELRKIAHPLALDSTQGNEFLLILKAHFIELENIAKSDMASDKRKLAIEQSKKEFSNRLKNIFTQEQYRKYRNIQQKNREQFLQKQQEKKIEVLEIKDDN
jgi:hypothetical protein